jgi:hypothetical protein
VLCFVDGLKLLVCLVCKITVNDIGLGALRRVNLIKSSRAISRVRCIRTPNAADSPRRLYQDNCYVDLP